MKSTESNKPADSPYRWAGVYKYRDEHGRLFFERHVLRNQDDRTDKQVPYRYGIGGEWAPGPSGMAWDRAPQMKGKPVYDSKHADDYPYHLPELLEAIRAGVPVIYWTEGESDARP